METKPFLSLGFLKPQCSLAPSMERGRSGEACSCFSGVCPLHQRRLSSVLQRGMKTEIICDVDEVENKLLTDVSVIQIILDEEEEERLV
ncbi:hypothetical protein JOB18_040231 [Solea senegalensis]|uniref:Uncharacterized protein n=1 Tax=Solea senegalensis TaxID=28829 RepID=A0AAV6PGT9_SOLSE|nr:hypothetical protein JOB18_040231 [Solea senegalensis]